MTPHTSNLGPLMTYHQRSVALSNTTKMATLSDLLWHALALHFTSPLNSSLTFWHRSKIVTAFQLLTHSRVSRGNSSTNYAHRSFLLIIIADINIQNDETMVSFDMVSLFTAIPVHKACNYIRRKLEDDSSLHSRTKLDIDDIIWLLNFVLSNNYFVYNHSTYKQIHGCAMGSPVSPVVANLCMEEIEKNSYQCDTCHSESLEAICRWQFLHY